MTVWLISRHIGAREWLMKQPHWRNAVIESRIHLVEDETEKTAQDHVALSEIHRDDVVVGILPLHLIAALTKRNIPYLHLSLPELTLEERGREFSAEDMEKMGPSLEEFTAYSHSTSTNSKTMIEERPISLDEKAPIIEPTSKRRSTFWSNLSDLIKIIGLVWLGGLSGDALWESFSTGSDWIQTCLQQAACAPISESMRISLMNMIFILLFLLLVNHIYRNRKDFFSVEGPIEVEPRYAGRNYIVMGVSKQNYDRTGKKFKSPEEKKRWAEAVYDDMFQAIRNKSSSEIVDFFDTCLTVPGDPSKDDEHPLKGAQLQQNLRSIRFHLQNYDRSDKILKIALLVSNHTQEEARLLKSLIDAFADAKGLEPEVLFVDSPSDPNDFERLEIAVKYALKVLAPPTMKCATVDITSMTAVYSVVGAVATMKKDLVFTYVDNEGEPRLYDTRIRLFSPELG